MREFDTFQESASKALPLFIGNPAGTFHWHAYCYCPATEQANMNKKPNWELTEELDAIKCPLCGGYDRLRLSADKKYIYCACCGDAITPAYLLTQGFVLETALQVYE